MMRYEQVYPSDPLLKSGDIVRPRAADLLSLEFFEAEPAAMETAVFSEHHLLLNLKQEPHRVENWRDGEHRDFTYSKDEIILTPAGIESGWQWHSKSKVIVITLHPSRLKLFAETELGILLEEEQLKSVPQAEDAQLCAAGVMMLEALKDRPLGFEVAYESLCRVFLVQLLQKYGIERAQGTDFSQGFTSQQYERVLAFVADNYSGAIAIEDLAMAAGWSTGHFSRLFKQTMGETPHRFIMKYRVEKARRMLDTSSRALIDVALACGFSDQAHFTRYFKQLIGQTPKQYRQNK